MQVIESGKGLRPLAAPLCLMIGNFDGIHLGHRTIIERARQIAETHVFQTAVLSFDPHPLKFLRPDYAPALLYGAEQKRNLLEQQGVDYLLVQKFDQAFSELSPEAFLDQLERWADLQYVLVGFNFRFGNRRAGTVETLKARGREKGYEIIEIEAFLREQEPVSSSRIRKLVKAGDLAAAGRLLGAPYHLMGTVSKGQQIGRKLDSPTANLVPENELIPAYGVYASWTRVDGQWYRSITNIGSAPTLDRGYPLIETHLFEYRGDLYGKRITVVPGQRLREEKRFESTEALGKQIAEDIRHRLEAEDVTPPDGLS